MPAPIFKKLIILIASFFLWVPIFVFAAVSQIIFTTDLQTIKPSEISGTLSIQIQDASGVSTPATETMDIEFLSSSPSGEFLSPSSANPVTKTISTGTANKNFRYRDIAEGIFVINVNAKGRVSGASFSTTQNITISKGVSASSTAQNTASSTDNLTATSTDSASPIVSINATIPKTAYSYSVYYAPVAPTSFKTDGSLQLGVGPDRLAAVGNPLEFQVQTNLSYLKSTIFKWNFGDGKEAFGETVTHVYEYPGEYVVVVNASSPTDKAVARANVKVIEPDLKVLEADPDKIEIRNNSDEEVSLFGKALWARGSVFVFPQDTIVRPQQNILFSSQVTSLAPETVSDVQILTIGGVEPVKMASKVEEQKMIKISSLKNKLSILEGQLAITSSYNLRPAKTDKPSLSQASTSVSSESPQPKSGTAAAEEGWFTLLRHFLLKTK